jgi:DHA2 family multidrug resistance protein
MTEESAQEGRHRVTITVLVLLAAMMQTRDTTIVKVALPYVQGSLAASNDQIDWVLTSYITAAAIVTPPTGFWSLVSASSVCSSCRRLVSQSPRCFAA